MWVSAYDFKEYKIPCHSRFGTMKADEISSPSFGNCRASIAEIVNISKANEKTTWNMTLLICFYSQDYVSLQLAMKSWLSQQYASDNKTHMSKESNACNNFFFQVDITGNRKNQTNGIFNSSLRKIQEPRCRYGYASKFKAVESYVAPFFLI